MKAIITVVGKDRVGIIAGISAVLAEHSVNILNINQNILEGYFNMVMIADMASSNFSIKELQDNLNGIGGKLGVVVKVQHEDIFNLVHKV